MTRILPILAAGIVCGLLTACPNREPIGATSAPDPAPAAAVPAPAIASTAPVPTPASSASEGPVQLTRGPYLQAASPDAIHLVWRVRREIQPAVRYGASWNSLDQSVPAEAITLRRTLAAGGSTNGALPLHSAPAGTIQYEVKITGLKPDTRYYYSVFDGARSLTPEDEEHYFTTLPVPGTPRPLRMWVVGDSGMANTFQKNSHAAMRDFVKKENRPLDLYLHVGDMAYGSGLDSEFQLTFFQIYQDTLRNTVCWPALGNHEGKTSNGPKGIGPYFDAYIVPTDGESGGVASGTEQYYSFDIGRVHFICLNSYDTSRKADGVMAQWLKADLEKTKQDWLIVFFHHPPYTKGSHDSDDIRGDKELVEMRENIMPILEGGGVDLVLAGHSHIYERSYLIDGAYNTPTTAAGSVLDDGDGNPAGSGPYKKSAGLPPHQGTVAVVAGHGGAKLGRKSGPSPVMFASILEYGSFLLDLDGDTLIGRMLDSKGEIRDTFQVIKRGQVQLAAIANPKPPGPFTGSILPLPRVGGTENSATRELPGSFVTVIPRGAEWEYLGGKDPGADWTTATGGWPVGKAGFGYGDDDDVTIIKDMRGRYRFLCIRREFELTGKEDLAKLGLAIAYDDGFICYLNGREAARANVDEGNLQAARGIKSYDSRGKFRWFSLADAAAALKPGKNVIAIEVHNDDLDSSDLTLDPWVIQATGALPAGGKDPDDDE
jgi:3',5'-cyclic AMP phosphodiesterase CpdA